MLKMLFFNTRLIDSNHSFYVSIFSRIKEYIYNWKTLREGRPWNKSLKRRLGTLHSPTLITAETAPALQYKVERKRARARLAHSRHSIFLVWND